MLRHLPENEALILFLYFLRLVNKHLVLQKKWFHHIINSKVKMRKTSIENIRSRGVLEDATTTAASTLLCFPIVGDVGHNTPLDPFCLLTNTKSKCKMKEFRKHKKH